MTRLIDANALEEKIIDLLEIEWGYKGIREDVSRIIDSIPTTEERPRGECRICTHYNLFGIDENTRYCDHPALYCDDPFCGVALGTKPQDTCSYFAAKVGDEE